MIPLDVLRLGAITPLGFGAPPTCAAFRAGIKGLEVIFQPPFPSEPIIGGRVASSVRLRRSYAEWLANLACHALAEALEGFEAADDTALILNLSNESRAHPDLPPASAATILAALQYKTKLKFRHTEIIRGGSSGAFAAIVRAQELLSTKTVRFCCVGGVDSLVNSYDIHRLKAQQRLHDEDHPMGIMPSEGAGFFLLAPADAEGHKLSRILGAAVIKETAGQTRAPGLRRCFETALQQAAIQESSIGFLVTDHAGERSIGLDHIIARMRTFRSRRASLPHWTFAEAAGDTSAASGALAVVLATTAHFKGYGHGPYALCAASSDDGWYGACVIGASP